MRAAPLPAMRAAGTGRGRSAGRSAATVGRGASRTSFERDARRQAGRSLAETKEQTRAGDSGCRWPAGELSMGQLRLARFEDQVTARQLAFRAEVKVTMCEEAGAEFRTQDKRYRFG